jgi:two-component system CheB/CheR fusion protein
MTETATLADHIDQHVDAIIAVWKATVEQVGDVPDAERLSNREFLDHVPELIERIADRLRGVDADASETGQKHGQHRWNQGYDIAEVIRELAHLRAALLRSTLGFASDKGLEMPRLEVMIRVVNGVLDEAAAESVRQFQEDSQALSRAMLDESESRKAAEEAERIKLETMLDNLPVGVWVVDASGRMLSVNRHGLELQGLDKSSRPADLNLFSDPLPYRRLRPDTGEEYPVEELPIVRSLRGETVLQQDMIWASPNSELSISVNSAPLVSPSGEVTGGVVVALDITDRKRLEAELAISEAQFRGIVEQSPVMIWRSAASGQRDFFNQTWLDFRGRELAHEVGDGWTEGVHPEDLERVVNGFRSAFAQRSSYEVVYRIRERTGHYRSVTDRGAPYCDASGRFLGYLGSCLDITERVELESRLVEQSQHKSRLMSALSHDVRTPLNAVVLSAKLLESQAKNQDDPEVQESLRTIRHSVSNVLDLLSDLLNLTRIDAGATLAETSRFPLGETLAECLSSIEPQAHAKGLSVRLEPGDLASARLDTDRSKLKQILSNLLSNALRYTEAGSIRLYATRSRGSVRIAVEDTGVGIASEDQERIFDEFAVLEHPNRPRGEGTGLGLAICRRLAKLLHGEILLESVRGQGSTFTLALPESVLTPDSAPADPPRIDRTRDFTGAILIAEDHEDSRRALAKVLRRLGYRVLEAGDGREVLDLVRQERPMVVLMDVNMPGLDGVEATMALRQDPEFRDLPIFALTGDVTAVNQQRIGEAGVDGYLEKPVTWDRLEAALDRLRSRTA